MPRSKKIVSLPDVEAGSYDPTRPLTKNTLLLNQVMHFQKIEREQMNEGQAAEYIQRMTAILHPKTVTTGGTRSE
jgi:hypothetical protein